MISENIRSFFLFFFISFHCIFLFAGWSSQKKDGESNIFLPFQLIISEIMADPDPQTRLPEYEYVEVYNRGISSVDVTGWKLIIGIHELVLPPGILKSGTYLIICDSEVQYIYNQYGQTLTVNNMPHILNSGQTLTLKAPSDEVIHSVSFTSHWYRNNEKANGGWSLEIIDPNNMCGGKENWRASDDVNGGTPGRQNSVNAVNPDNSEPILLRATLPSDSTVLLYFNEPMRNISLSDEGNYSTNNGMLHPCLAQGVDPDYRKAELHYPAAFASDRIYTVTILNTLEDCAGNHVADNSFVNFTMCRTADTADVVINEILFNAGKKSEFVELYNRSDHAIELSSLTLSLADGSTGIVKKKISFETIPYILFPYNYVAITGDADQITRYGISDNRKYIVAVPTFFSLPDQEGTIILSDTADTIIDEVFYHEKLHHVILKETSGISLERVNADLPSQDAKNWCSASTTSGYGTPGLPNSQMSLPDNCWNIDLSSEYLSPDNDGTDDYIIIHLHLNGISWTGSLGIFDMRGIQVKCLTDDSLLGTDEYFTWHGEINNGSIASVGLYLIYGEIYNAGGKSKKIKKVIPLIMK